MLKSLIPVALLLATAHSAFGLPTRVMVRAQAADAKFIGDHTGGVRVTLTETSSGKVLASGLIRGGTGDTARIMTSPRARGAALADAGTAGFEAKLDLAEPTLVRIEAQGPVGKPASAISVSTTVWVIPGRDLLGDGVVLTFPGLVVEPSVDAQSDGQMRLAARISPMCGCPIEAGGPWDAANYSVKARLRRANQQVAELSLAFTGRTGEYAGAIPKPAKGHYTVDFIAVDARTPNSGVVSQAVDVGD